MTSLEKSDVWSKPKALVPKADMVLPSSSWAFSDSLGHHRLDLLKNAPPFEEIARTIATLMRIQCSHPDPCDEADGFKRLVVCFVDR